MPALQAIFDRSKQGQSSIDQRGRYRQDWQALKQHTCYSAGLKTQRVIEAVKHSIKGIRRGQ